MNVEKMISELRRQQRQIEQAIEVFEQLVLSSPKKRGRPPKWILEAGAEECAKSNSAAGLCEAG